MTDDELFDRLRAADPAASLSAADPDRVARLLEDVMSTEPTTENRQSGTRHRGRLTWLVAAAAVVVIAGVGLLGVRAITGDDPAPVGTSEAPPAAGSQTVTELAAPDEAAYAARCAAPSADTLATQTVAFDGVVTRVADGAVTLDPSHWYAGDETDLVRVRAPDEQLSQLIESVDFRDGERYLVAADDGRVAICGLSGPYSEELAGLYQQAFGG